MVLLVVFFIVMFSSTTSAEDSNASVGADHPYIQYTGRIDWTHPKAPRFDWPGVSILARFTGTFCAIRLKDADNMYDVLLDGNDLPPLKPNPTRTVYKLVDGAPEGVHTIMITKRTEGMFGVAEFGGLILDPGAKLLPQPERPRRRIEFIGDSLTCGFGNEGKNPCFIYREHENNYMAFGPIAARLLNAECVVIAKSGEGMVRNASDVQALSDDPMPFYYDRTCENAPQPKWDFSKWVPDVVVVTLGANDYAGTGPHPSFGTYVEGYKTLLTRIRRNYPHAHICCFNPRYSMVLDPCIRQVVDLANRNGDPNVHYVELDFTVMPWTLDNDELGCLAHLRVSVHQRIGKELAENIGPIMGWSIRSKEMVCNAPIHAGILSGTINLCRYGKRSAR